MQSVTLDPNEYSDCGSKATLSIKLTDKNAEDYIWQNMIENGKIINLTPDNVDQYIGKEIHFRSPMYCKNDKTCAVCAGKRFYLYNIENVGLVSGRMSNTLLNKSMKLFHKAKLELDEVDPDSLIL